MSETYDLYQQGGRLLAQKARRGFFSCWVGLQRSSFSKCLDLRGDAETDPISLPFPVIMLSELFDALRDEREKLAGRVDAARAEDAKIRLADRSSLSITCEK